MIPADLKKYYDLLNKAGKAEITIVLVAAPGDEDFRRNPPVSLVTITAHNPATGRDYREAREVSVATDERVFTIPVQTRVGVLKSAWNRLLGRKKEPPYNVTIAVEPLDGWEQHYSPTSKPAHATPGRNPPIHVWMVPK
jgi:hypothetical protein